MSDQDFFFDEDEQPKAAEKSAPAKRTGGSSKSAGAKSSKSAAAPEAAAGAQSVSMTIAGLIGVIALLVGVIIGILLPLDGSTGTAGVGATGSPAGQTAPQLSPEQMQGGLPQGHPDINSMGGGATAATGSAETTAK